MKYLFTIVLVLFALSLPTFADNTNTNTNQTVLEQAATVAKQTVATNLNEVIVDILRGVKGAGSEVYQASKTAITKSVDFTIEQAPLVVKEFLTWSLAKSIIWITLWTGVACFFLFCSRVANKRSKDESLPRQSRSETSQGDFTAFKWVWRTIAVIILCINFTTNGMQVAKITLAPRVYLIEYVVDALQPNHR